MMQINLVLTVAMCVEVPEDFNSDVSNLFIENEELLLMNGEDWDRYHSKQFETLDVVIQKPVTFDN